MCLFVCVGSFALMAPSFAQAENADILNRMKRIENEVDTLNRAVYKGERPPVSQEAQNATAGMEARLSQIETELRNVTGKLEQQAYDNQQLQQRLDALEQDTRMRLDTLEKQSRNPAPVMPQPMVDTNTVPPPGMQPAPDPQMQTPQTTAPSEAAPSAGVTDAAVLYERGFAEIKANNYDAAELSFAAFMKDYPTHALAPNALYWLGETYYVRKNYDKAARTFAEAYQKFPGGPKGADNLLKLGMSLSAKGEKSNACIALGQLKKEYPNGPEPVLKRGADEMTALGCP